MMGTTNDGALGRLDEARDYVRTQSELVPRLAIIAGSGLSALGDLLDDATRVSYADIPYMHAPTVVGHRGELVLGTLESVPVAVLSGRVHAYEGHPMEDVVFGARLVARLGATQVLITNAAGGIQPWLIPGTLCRIVDHINHTGLNPLSGPNIEALGPRFPDMSEAYSRRLGDSLEAAARASSTTLMSGIYCAVQGPSYETPAEIRMLRAMGATLVGMSTVFESIALNHMGVEVCGLSVVTNHAAGVSAQKLSHAEVKETANMVKPKLLALMRAFARELAS